MDQVWIFSVKSLGNKHKYSFAHSYQWNFIGSPIGSVLLSIITMISACVYVLLPSKSCMVSRDTCISHLMNTEQKANQITCIDIRCQNYFNWTMAKPYCLPYMRQAKLKLRVPFALFSWDFHSKGYNPFIHSIQSKSNNNGWFQPKSNTLNCIIFNVVLLVNVVSSYKILTHTQKTIKSEINYFMTWLYSIQSM